MYESPLYETQDISGRLAELSRLALFKVFSSCLPFVEYPQRLQFIYSECINCTSVENAIYEACSESMIVHFPILSILLTTAGPLPVLTLLANQTPNEADFACEAHIKELG
jgi:hypothetical protein